MAAGTTTRRLAFVGMSLIVALTVVMWTYIFFIADTNSVDTLNDKTFPTAAEPICARTVQALKDAGLPLKKADSPAERADLVDQADAMITVMVDQLRAIAPTSGPDAPTIKAWLADWDVWFSDRAKWAVILRSGEGSAFNETQRETGEPNSQALSKLAEVNSMRDCGIPYAV